MMMCKKEKTVIEKAVLLCRVDREDLWVSGFVFHTTKDLYEDIFNEIKHLLSTDEFIKHLIAEFYLDDDYFDNDSTYKLINITYNMNVYFVFENQNGNTIKLCLKFDDVNIVRKQN